MDARVWVTFLLMFALALIGFALGRESAKHARPRREHITDEDSGSK